jgi:hypothetical protein
MWNDKQKNAKNGQQFMPGSDGEAPPAREGSFGAGRSKAGKPVPPKARPNIAKGPGTTKRYDTATNTFRMMPAKKKIGQANGLPGSGHDGEGNEGNGPGRDGRVCGTEPTPQGDFESTGPDQNAECYSPDVQGMTPRGKKIGQGMKLSGRKA